MTAPIRPPDVFLSYSRRSPAVCDQVMALVEGKLNLAVFRDVDDIHPGARWTVEIQRLLDAGLRPAVLLLATRAAIDRPDNIVHELTLALRNGLHIVPIEIEPGCARPILNAAISAAGPMSDHDQGLPQVVSVSDLPSGSSRLEDELRRGLLGPRLEELLARRSEEYAAWRANLTREQSFWADAISPYADTITASGGLVLIGPAGAGKSSLAAHIVDRLPAEALSAPQRTAQGRPIRLRPLLLRESDLRDRGDNLAREIGARNVEELQAHLEACRHAFGVQILFVVDGLDQMAPDIGKTFHEYAKSLARLSRVAPTMVTCRREVWDEAYSRELSLRRHDIEEIAPATVQRALEARFPRRDLHANPLLRRALFLDLCLTHGERWGTVPDDDLLFIGQLWRDLANDHRQPSRGGLVSNRGALNAIADAQLERSRFDVPWKALTAPLSVDVVAALNTLIESRILRRTADGTVRFSHDLLDAFSMAEGLFAAPHRIEAFLQALAEDGMWSVAATYAALARRRNPELVRALFARFLDILDDKPKGDPAMARAWAVTYALQERFEDFLPFILECFSTDELLRGDATDLRSSLSPPRLTQPAASTLASAFLALQGGRVADAAQVLPRLQGKLYSWRLRFRVVDAIAKFDAPEARDALLGFARSQIKARAQHSDSYDERALVAAIRALGAYDDAAVGEALRVLEQDNTLHPRIRRAAQQSLGQGRSSLAKPLVLTEEEIVADLSPFERVSNQENGKRYTDWRGVEAAAKAVESRIRSTGSQPSKVVVAALIGALDHVQTAVRCTVAECLALVDSPDAGAALVAELGETDVPPQVRGACVAAVRCVLQRTSGQRRLALRLDVARAGLVARWRGLDRAAEALWELSTGREMTGCWPIIGLGAALTPIGIGALQCDETFAEAPPPTSWAGSILHPDELAAVGPEFEAKFRYTKVSSDGDGLTLSIERSSWPVARTFHLVARAAPERIAPQFPTAALLPRPLGGAAAPGVACVHVIVRTSDACVLLAQRSPKASYFPSAWSVSFEEQVTARLDGTPEDAIDAARRGFEEEFGLTVARNAATVRGAMLELDTFNVVVVVRLDVPHTAEEIRIRRTTEPRPRHHDATAALAFLDDAPTRLTALVEGDTDHWPLHPTAHLRLLFAGLVDHDPGADSRG
ncbi:MAG: hypothetical protein MUC36_07245 [Planctomycetes bacterium]|jgi:hypothetical protein|nr:hypothetical protein [Planctomycetota bacterium]